MLSQTATASNNSPRAISIAIIAMHFSRLYVAVEKEADFILIRIMGLFKFIPYCSIAELCHSRESLSRIIIPLWCSSDREARKLAPLGAF